MKNLKRIKHALNPNREAVKLFERNIPQVKNVNEYEEIATPPIISNIFLIFRLFRF